MTYNKDRWLLDTIKKVWEKGRIVSSEDTSVFRKDACGAWIQLSKHGDRNSDYGWEIDHIQPVALGGSDFLSNLQPLHWKNNVEKGDSSTLKCAVSN